MAKQKPKAKVASTTKPKYPQAELKNIGMGYDKIGFKNSSIDMIKSKMNAQMEEQADIVPEKYMPARPEMSTKEFPLRREGWPGGVMMDYSKRNEYIKKAYEGYGELTGKKGVSKKAYAKYPNLMEAYRKDPKLDANISATVFEEQSRKKKK